MSSQMPCGGPSTGHDGLFARSFVAPSSRRSAASSLYTGVCSAMNGMKRRLPIRRGDRRVGAVSQQDLHDLEIAVERRTNERRGASREHRAAHVRRLEEQLYVRIGAALEQQVDDRETPGGVQRIDGR